MCTCSSTDVNCLNSYSIRLMLINSCAYIYCVIICDFWLLQLYNDVNLLAIPSTGVPTKYALKVFKVLFTDEEMETGMIGPVNRAITPGKVELDEEVSLFKVSFHNCNTDAQLPKSCKAFAGDQVHCSMLKLQFVMWSM